MGEARRSGLTSVAGFITTPVMCLVILPVGLIIAEAIAKALDKLP